MGYYGSQSLLKPRYGWEGLTMLLYTIFPFPREANSG